MEGGTAWQWFPRFLSSRSTLKARSFGRARKLPSLLRLERGKAQILREGPANICARAPANWLVALQSLKPRPNPFPVHLSELPNRVAVHMPRVHTPTSIEASIVPTWNARFCSDPREFSRSSILTDRAFMRPSSRPTRPTARVRTYLDTGKIFTAPCCLQ